MTTETKRIVTVGSPEYYGFFHNHEMFSYVAGCQMVTFDKIVGAGVEAMKAFEAEENLENFERIQAVQHEQEFFHIDFKSTLAEHDIELQDDEDF